MQCLWETTEAPADVSGAGGVRGNKGRHQPGRSRIRGENDSTASEADTRARVQATCTHLPTAHVYATWNAMYCTIALILVKLVVSLSGTHIPAVREQMH